jgi:hypothetical protein
MAGFKAAGGRLLEPTSLDHGQHRNPPLHGHGRDSPKPEPRSAPAHRKDLTLHAIAVTKGQEPYFGMCVSRVVSGYFSI